MRIKVFIVDDHTWLIRGLRFFLRTQPDIELIGEATSGEEAVEKIGELHPDVVLMDLIMPGMTGIEATGQIVKKQPGTKVIILTSFSDRDHISPAIQAGASGYLMKDIKPGELVQIIRKVYQGEEQFIRT